MHNEKNSCRSFPESTTLKPLVCNGMFPLKLYKLIGEGGNIQDVE